MIVRRVFVAAMLIVGLVGVTAAGASAETVSPAEWAPKFCSALTTYQDTLKKGTDDLTSTLSGSTNLKKARAKIVAFLGKMSDAAKTAKSDLQAAGEPSSTNGDKVAGEFVSALGKSSDLFSKAKAQAAKVSVSNPKAFAKQGAKVGTDLQDAAGKLSATFSDLPTLDSAGELAVALQGEQACSSLGL